MSRDGTRKREGEDLYNARSSPSRRWHSAANERDHDDPLGLLMDREGPRLAAAAAAAAATDHRYSQLVDEDRFDRAMTTLATRQPTTNSTITTSTSDRIAEVSRLRQEIAIQERLLNEAILREQHLRRLHVHQRQMDVPLPPTLVDPYYVRGLGGNVADTNSVVTGTNIHSSLTERIHQLERELELSRMGQQIEGQMLHQSTALGRGLSLNLSIDRLNQVARSQEAERALQRLISLREEDPRQRFIDEFRLQDSRHHSSLHHHGGLSTINPQMASHSNSILGSRATSQDSSHLLGGRSGEGAAPVSSIRAQSYHKSSKKDRTPSREEPVQTGPSVPVEESKIVGMVLPTDVSSLSQYQATIRAALEFFTASREDAMSIVQGRKKRIRLYQVGIRCKYCAQLPLKDRSTGAVYFPASLGSVYQAAQNVASVHMLAERKTKTGACPLIPKDFQKKLEDSKNVKAGSLVGKQYWADSCRELGITEEDGGLWFPKSLNSNLADEVRPESERQSEKHIEQKYSQGSVGDEDEEDSQGDDDEEEEEEDDSNDAETAKHASVV